MKSQDATESTALDDRKLVAGNCERFINCARVAHQCKQLSATLSAAAFFALLAEREDKKNRCEALAIKSQGIFGLFGLASKTEWLQETPAELEKAGTA